MSVNPDRIAALACALVTEALRIYSNEQRDRVSLYSIQRDADNYEGFISQGIWTHRVVREQVPDAVK